VLAVIITDRVATPDPAVVTVEPTATVGEQATVTVSYTSGANTFTANATLTVKASP
jgi:hypothetical protein